MHNVLEALCLVRADLNEAGTVEGNHFAATQGTVPNHHLTLAFVRPVHS